MNGNRKTVRKPLTVIARLHNSCCAKVEQKSNCNGFFQPSAVSVNSQNNHAATLLSRLMRLLLDNPLALDWQLVLRMLQAASSGIADEPA